MKVYIPTPLRTYTGESGVVTATGATLEALLKDLDQQYPGVRFRIINEQDRIREHIKIFINQEQARSLNEPVKVSDEVQIICALSGGSASG